MSKRGAIHRSGEDRISALPDDLLCQILSNLPTKDAVKTSIFSSRWRNVWLSTPLLDIDIYDFNGFITFFNFASRFLDFSKDSCLHKLKLSFKRLDADLCYIKLWILEEVELKIQHLEVNSRTSLLLDQMPLTLNLCETLVSLRLRSVVVSQFVFVSLPNLRVMHLEENMYFFDKILEKFISSCPVLEDLTVVRNIEKTTERVLRVCSRTLSTLKLVLDSSKSWNIDDSDDWKVFIDAPRLAYLSLIDDHSASFVMSNLGSLAEVHINISFNVNNIWDIDDSFERSAVRTLLTGLSSVRDMTISGTTLKIIGHYLKHERMPQFRNMMRLHAKFYISDLGMLLGVLESCPNLKSLVLELEGVMEKEEMGFSSVPKCLQSSLENVEIIRPKYGNGGEMMLIKYFLENSLVLKKLTLCVDCHSKEQESLIVTELKTFQRGFQCLASQRFDLKIRVSLMLLGWNILVFVVWVGVSVDRMLLLAFGGKPLEDW